VEKIDLIFSVHETLEMSWVCYKYYEYNLVWYLDTKVEIDSELNRFNNMNENGKYIYM